MFVRPTRLEWPAKAWGVDGLCRTDESGRRKNVCLSVPMSVFRRNVIVIRDESPCMQ